MQTIDDLDLLKYVAGGDEVEPPAGDGDGDGGGGGGGGGGGDGDGDGSSSSVVAAATAAVAASGAASDTNATVAQDASNGQLTALVEEFDSEVVGSFGTSGNAGYEAGLSGVNLEQAQLANPSAFDANFAAFAGGWILGHARR